MFGVIDAVLVQGQTMEELSWRHGVLRYHGRLFRDGLDELAIFFMGYPQNEFACTANHPLSGMMRF